MSGESPGQPTVLVVDDQKEVADAYALRLEGVAEVSTAYRGATALETYEANAPIDVVLLDRHMPSRSGDDLLAELRERDVDSRVIMITAIDPDLNILELPFDDYLCKPVEREDIRTAVDQQCRVLAYELLGRYFRLESKRAVIEAELPADTLREHPEFADLDRETTALAERIRRLVPDAGELLSTFSGVSRESR